MKVLRTTRLVSAAILLAALYFNPACSQAASTMFTLPDTDNFNNITIGHRADGTFIYGHNGTLISQDAFGSTATTTFANAPGGVDYSFVTPNFLGTANGFSAGPVYSFDGSSTSSVFTSIGTFQTFGAVAYNSSNLLVVGINGGNSDLSYLTADGTFTTLIDNVSAFSGGIAADDAGNVYLADADDNNIYRFAASQINDAIAGTTLTIADGTLVANLGVSASLAIESGTNRLYAAGFQSNGIQVFDIATEVSGTIIPGADVSTYQVSTFSDGTTDYVGYITRSGFSGGDTVTYGFQDATTVAIPEPSTYLMFFAGLALVYFVRNRKQVR